MSLDHVDLSDPDTFVTGIPHAAFKRLRAEAPVYWQPRAGRAAASGRSRATRTSWRSRRTR